VRVLADDKGLEMLLGRPFSPDARLPGQFHDPKCWRTGRRRRRRTCPRVGGPRIELSIVIW
jgi:hypothetical protein